MSNLRVEFEALFEIKKILDDNKSSFNGDYYNLPFDSCAESFVNGAWEVFKKKQEQIINLVEEYAETENHLKERINQLETRIKEQEFIIKANVEHIQALNIKNNKPKTIVQLQRDINSLTLERDLLIREQKADKSHRKKL